MLQHNEQFSHEMDGLNLEVYRELERIAGQLHVEEKAAMERKSREASNG